MLPGNIGQNMHGLTSYAFSSNQKACATADSKKRTSTISITRTPSSGSFEIWDNSDKRIATDIVMELHQFLKTYFLSDKDKELIEAIRGKKLTPQMCEDALTLINIYRSHIRIVNEDPNSKTYCWSEERWVSESSDSDEFVEVDINVKGVQAKEKSTILVFNITRIGVEILPRYSETIKANEYDEYSETTYANGNKTKMTREQWDGQYKPQLVLKKPGSKTLPLPSAVLPLVENNIKNSNSSAKQLQGRQSENLPLNRPKLMDSSQLGEKEKDCWEVCVLF